jgi:hypothetical protein
MNKNINVKVDKHIHDGKILGWFIHPYEVKSSEVTTYYSSDKTVAALLGMLLVDYRTFLKDYGAVEQPANGVTYFETQEEAEMVASIIDDLIREM